MLFLMKDIPPPTTILKQNYVCHHLIMSWFNIQNQNWSVCITFNPYLRIAYLARRRPPPFRSFPPRKMSRNIARALVPEQGPEAAAIVNLNSEETRPLGAKKYNVGGVGGCLGRVMGYTHRIFFLGGGRLLYNTWNMWCITDTFPPWIAGLFCRVSKRRWSLLEECFVTQPRPLYSWLPHLLCRSFGKCR